MQDQPLCRRDAPKWCEHLHHADDFAQPVDAAQAVVDGAENRNQERRQQQRIERAF
jgi:hypothetical protein